MLAAWCHQWAILLKIYFKIYFICMSYVYGRVCLCAYMHTACMPGVRRGQETSSDPWGWSHGYEAGSSARQPVIFSAEMAPQTPCAKVTWGSGLSSKDNRVGPYRNSFWTWRPGRATGKSLTGRNSTCSPHSGCPRPNPAACEVQISDTRLHADIRWPFPLSLSVVSQQSCQEKQGWMRSVPC